jgi:hypothetical protein
MGTDFDPILLKVFVSMMGTYPPGTLLQLDSGEMGLVVDYKLDDRGQLPRVVLLKPDGRGGIRRGRMVALGAKDSQSGVSNQIVSRTLDPTAYGIQPSDYII